MKVFMDFLKYALVSINYAVGSVAIIVIVLMLVRLILNYADLNPFSRPVLLARRFSDPLVSPVRRSLLQFGFSPNLAPLVVILVTILLGYFAILLATSIIGTIGGVWLNALALSVHRTAFVAIIGYLLYGFLDVYVLLIFMRIIFSWGGVGYSNRVMRFLINATDPLLVPLRRMIPPLGMFDLSPIVAFMLLWLLKAAVSVVLIAGFDVARLRI